MQLTLSGRIVEQSGGTSMPVPDFVRMAANCGYDSVDLRATQVEPGTSEEDLSSLERALAETGLSVAMLNLRSLPQTGQGEGLEEMFDLAERLSCRTIRAAGSVEACRNSAGAARERGLRLCSQIHTGGEDETIPLALETLAQIGCEN